MSQSKHKIAIVEDDPLISLDLQEILLENNYLVSDVYHSGEEAIEQMNPKTDLALLDINLDGAMTGIELGIELKKREIPCIFITSYYDNKTLEKARIADPLAYIIKPFEEHEIIANVKLGLSKISSSESEVAMEPQKPVFLKSGTKMQRLIPDEIDYIEAYDVYSQVWSNGKRMTASHTLKGISQLLNFPFLVRVHRSYIVNINKVQSICEDAVVIGENKIPIGRTYKKTFFDLIQLI